MRKLYPLIFLILTLAPSFMSCTKNQSTNSVNQTARKVSIPDTLFLIADDSLRKINPKEFVNWSTAVILTSIWGDCHVCMKKFREWEKILDKELFQGVEVVYIVTTSYPEYFMRVFLPEISYKGLLLIDDKDSFFSLNGLLYSTPHLNTLLVDSNLNIVLQGDPLATPAMLEKYEREINHLRNL